MASLSKSYPGFFNTFISVIVPSFSITKDTITLTTTTSSSSGVLNFSPTCFLNLSIPPGKSGCSSNAAVTIGPSGAFTSETNVVPPPLFGSGFTPVPPGIPVGVLVVGSSEVIGTSGSD